MFLFLLFFGREGNFFNILKVFVSFFAYIFRGYSCIRCQLIIGKVSSIFGLAESPYCLAANSLG